MYKGTKTFKISQGNVVNLNIKARLRLWTSYMCHRTDGVKEKKGKLCLLICQTFLPKHSDLPSFCSSYRLMNVHTTPKIVENAALFLRLDLPSTLIRQENGTLRRHSSNQRNLKTLALRFRLDGKHFVDGALRKRWRHDNHVISLPEFSSNTNPKWPVIVAFLNSSGVVWTENIWYIFRV